MASELSDGVKRRIDRALEKGLTGLDLSYSGLIEVPKAVFKLKNLTHLCLSMNELTHLPKEIAQLTNLNKLDLRFNKLTHLPAEIGQLTNLNDLYLHNNKLIYLPIEIGQLTNLNGLYIHNNKLTHLPGEIGRLTNLTRLDIRYNFLETPPPEIVDQGLKAILNYLREQLETGIDHIYEAKLLIVGEERAGKTSLMKSLANSDYHLEDEQSTEGINIQSWCIKKEEVELEKDFTLNVWDFGGQEIYHTTHQFFLTKRSIYLLVSEPRKEVKHDDFYYWLNIISLLGDNSPVVLVQNKCDQPLEDLPVREYKEFFKNIVGNLERTSCKPDRKETIKNLQKVINKVTITLPHVDTKVPKVWADIREELLKRKNETYITYQEYLKICQRYQMDRGRAGFLAEFFHDLGTFLHFRNNFLLKKSIFLDNEWVTHGVYKVLDDKEVIEKNGKFSNDDLKRLWKNTSYNGWEAEFIELMHEFKICYPLKTRKTKKKWYLAPSRLPKDKPETLDWEIDNNLRFEYKYKFMPKGMLTRFIVERYKNIYEDTQWRYGVLLKMDNTFALVQEDYFNRKIIIRLKGEEKRDVLVQIRDTFEDIHEDFNNLIVKGMVPCNCFECINHKEPNLYPYDELQRYIRKNIPKIRCGKSLEEMSVKGLLNAIKPIKLYKELFQALISCFPKKIDLTIMLRSYLDKNLDDIASGNSLKEVIHRLLQAAEAEGWLEELVKAAKEERPNNTDLALIARKMGITMG